MKGKLTKEDSLDFRTNTLICKPLSNCNECCRGYKDDDCYRIIKVTPNYIIIQRVQERIQELDREINGLKKSYRETSDKKYKKRLRKHIFIRKGRIRELKYFIGDLR